MHPLETRFIAEIEMLAEKHQCLIWAMNKTFTQELFVSSTFKTLWEREVPSIYRNKTFEEWDSYANNIMGDDKIWIKLSKRICNKKNTDLYYIKKLDGSNQLVMDRSFPLNDAEGNCLIYAGVAKFIPSSGSLHNEQKKISDELDCLCLDYYRLLILPYSLRTHNKSIFYSKLTLQQKTIFKYILSNLMAKEIAKKMNLSFRTIEFHINSIKKIFRVKSKSELISLAIEKNWVCVNL